MPEVQQDMQVIERLVQEKVNAAGLSDFKITFGKEDKLHRLSCTIAGSSVEITFRSQSFGKDLMKIESIEVGADRDRPCIYVADSEVKEMHAQRVGAPVVTKFQNLSLDACRSGLDFINEAFNAKTGLDLSKAHLTDIELTVTQDGRRQVKGNLILEDAILRARTSIGTNVANPQVLDVEPSAKSHAMAPAQKREMLTLNFELTEQEAPRSAICALERSVEVRCSTQDGYCVQSCGSGARMLFAAIHAYPDLAKVKATPLDELIAKIREASTETDSMAELRASRKILRNTIIFHFTDVAPVDRASLSEGDLILHAQPEPIPGISLQIYRVKAIEEDVNDDYEVDAKSKMRLTSADGEEVVYEVECLQQERFLRRVTETELPDGAPGLMNFRLDQDLTLKMLAIRRRKEIDDITQDLGIKANAAPSDIQLNASVRDGVFSWEVKISNEPPLLGMFGNDLPLTIFPSDDRNIRVVSGNREGSIERRILDIPRGTFEVPGYWKATPYIENLLIRYLKALSNCSDADVVALGLAGEP